MSDVLRLKYQNISGAEIIFERRKTKNKSEKTTIVSRLTEPLQKIIKEHSKFSINEDDFIFPELNNSMNEKQRYARIQSTTKLINKHLKRIADNLGFDNDLARCISTYYARHSYATLLKNDNVSVAEISESLGHSSIQTTQNYLSSIDVAQRTRTANQLVNLLK